jgi:hypothetical protein
VDQAFICVADLGQPKGISLKRRERTSRGRFSPTRQFGCSIIVAIVFTLGLVAETRADDFVTIWVDPSKSVDVYWSINLSGTVYVAADVDGQPACLDYWWIVWPFTQIQQLGHYCGRAKFALPGISSFAIGGKLRAGGATVRTRLRGTSTEGVAHKFPELKF